MEVEFETHQLLVATLPINDGHHPGIQSATLSVDAHHGVYPWQFGQSVTYQLTSSVVADTEIASHVVGGHLHKLRIFDIHGIE